jgi:hypothetical protein
MVKQPFTTTFTTSQWAGEDHSGKKEVWSNLLEMCKIDLRVGKHLLTECCRTYLVV